MTARAMTIIATALLVPGLNSDPARAADPLDGDTYNRKPALCSYRPQVIGRGKPAGTLLVFLGLPTDTTVLSQKLAEKGLSLKVEYASASSVEAGQDLLRTIEGPVFLAGYSRGGRVAMALAAMPEFQGKVKGSVLFAPQVKTVHAAWKRTFNQSLPAYSIVKQEVDRHRPYWRRECSGFECFDESLQETGVKKPTLLFYGLEDCAISKHYMQRVAEDSTNTGIRAFFFEGVNHGLYDVSSELVTGQISALIASTTTGEPWGLETAERVQKIALPPGTNPRRSWSFRDDSLADRWSTPDAKTSPAPRPLSWTKD